MNMSVTIPQLFYDVIARVVPGFVFLVALNLELSGTGLQVIERPTSSDNTIAVVFNSFGYCIVCYVIGWVLSALTFCGLRDEVEQECRNKLNLNEDSMSFSEMYQRIRFKNEAAGFRIAKLRAESRMLETSRSGMVYILLIAIGLLHISRCGWISSFQPSSLEWALRICVPIVIALALRKRERPAWKNYYANVYSVYTILFEPVAKSVEKQS